MPQEMLVETHPFNNSTNQKECVQKPSAHTAAVPKKRMVWVDIAKGISIIAVVFGHTISSGSTLHGVIYMFHMPLFFFMAGYTLKPKPAKQALLNSLKRLGGAYLCIALAWNIPFILESPGNFSLAGLKHLVLAITFASGSANDAMGIPSAGMAWFLACLFCARMITNNLLLIFERKKIAIPAQALIVIAIAACGILIGQVWHIYLPLSLDVAFVAVFLLWTGHYARTVEFFEKHGYTWYTALAALVIFVAAIKFSNLEMASREYGFAILSALGALSGIVLVSQLSILIQKHTRFLSCGLEFMGRNSLLIYAFHAIDWMWPWQNFASLQGMRLSNVIGGVIRLTQATLLTILVKKL